MNDSISKYAEDLKQLYVNLNNVGTLQFQKEGADFYVPLYERKLRKLKVALTLDTSAQDCFYIYGQPGFGKSTALNYFDDDDLRNSYELVLIRGRYLFDLQDIDIIDILLMFALELLKRLREKDMFEATIRKLYDQHIEKAEYVQEEAQREGANVNANVGLGIPFTKLLSLFIGAHANIEAEYHLETEKRELCRKFFNISKVDFLAMINQMIRQYAAENNQKQILVIWDDLEKIEKPSQIRDIFIENRSYLTDLQCKKIIITPVCLALEAKFLHQDSKEYFLGLKIKESIRGGVHSALEEDCELLRKIALSSLFIFICQNGDWWSTVNPLLEDSISLYLNEG